MRVCGVEMKGSEAILCLLAIDSGLFDIPDCRTVRLPLLKDQDSEQMKKFQFVFYLSTLKFAIFQMKSKKGNVSD